MRPIDADELCEGRVSNDPVVIAAKCAPTLDYAPVRHGEWIMKSHDNFGVCSCCNRSDHIDSLATHCRYCGAKTDGGKNDVRITD